MFLWRSANPERVTVVAVLAQVMLLVALGASLCVAFTTGVWAGLSINRCEATTLSFWGSIKCGLSLTGMLLITVMFVMAVNLILHGWTKLWTYTRQRAGIIKDLP